MENRRFCVQKRPANFDEALSVFSCQTPEGERLLPLVTQREVRNLLHVGASNPTIFAKVSQQMSNPLIGQTVDGRTNRTQLLDSQRSVSFRKSRQNVSLEAVILDLRLGRLTSSIALSIEQFNLMVDKSNHLSIVDNHSTNLSKHLFLCHSVAPLSFFCFVFSLSYVFIITYFFYFVKNFFYFLFRGGLA